MQNVPQPIDSVQENQEEQFEAAWNEQTQKEYAEWAAYNDAQWYGEQ